MKINEHIIEWCEAFMAFTIFYGSLWITDRIAEYWWLNGG